MRERVLALLAASRGPIAVRDIAKRADATTSVVNATLYRLLTERRVHKSSSERGTAPLWSVVANGSEAGLRNAARVMERVVAPVPRPAEMSGLYKWQEEALKKWEIKGHRGLLEAVTGSGKTRLAFAAVRRLEQADKRLATLVVVPTITLMDQWYAQALKFYGETPDRVGRLGDGHHDDFSKPGRRIVIGVANSASRHVNDILGFARNGLPKTLLIADEVHRLLYAEQHGRVLDFPFTYTLGMSATLNRSGDERLGDLFYQFTFEDAKQAGIVPEFDLIQTKIALTARERSNYDRTTEKLIDQLKLVKARYSRELWEIDNSFEETDLLRKLGCIQRRAPDREIERLFDCLFRRAAISHTCEEKISLAQRLGRFFMEQPGRGKRIFFFERVQSAEEIFESLEDREMETAFGQVATSVKGVGNAWCETLQSGIGSKRRKEILSDFRRWPAAVLLCCRMLDEGLDVPEIDVAVLVSSTQTKRQRVQRIGRALRKGKAGTRPLIISFYVAETTDAKTIEQDEHLFGSIATIYQETAETLLSRVQRILAERRP